VSWTSARHWAAEVAGTALLVGIGTGTVVAAARAGGIPQAWMALAWFVAVLVPIVLFIETSGAHLNPAVTLALALSGRFAWRSVPGYWGSQVLGALLASATVAATLGHAGHLGATIPTHGPLLLDFSGEAAFTALLIVSVFVVADLGEGSLRWRILLPPTAVGLSTFVIGPLTGSSLNPARTLAPALLSGTYTDLGWYLLVVPAAAVAVAAVWRPRSVDVADRGLGRRSADP
jgi:glycerol uptake facilitator-like aquaporin